MAALFVGAALSSGAACAPARPRDSVPEGTKDERTDRGEAEATYEHVARRPHVTVAVAESRGLERAEVASVVESIADRLEACTRELSPEQGGVVRVVARVGDDGAVDGLALPVQSGHVPTALRCVVGPVKLVVLHVPIGDAGAGNVRESAARGFAIEAEWRP
jgi:hypothetical protein